MIAPIIKCYQFNNIPGTHPGWTVACQAVSLPDARTWMRWHWGEGCKFVAQKGPGKIDANCGDITESARLILRSRME